MAELHGNGWPKRDNKKNRLVSIDSWADDDLIDEPAGPRDPIELHGAAYIAFCKPWAPLWVDPEEMLAAD
jgi:hypothetical protein